jgi:UDP-2,3-diacylglucosamine pyrophosphatase LpxH
MNWVVDQLRALGQRLEPVSVEGVPVALRWDPAATGPILGNRLLIAIPDLHLGDGGSADIFRGQAPAGDASRRGRLASFLQSLVAIKGALPAQGKSMSVVQLGDCFDVWRAFWSDPDQAGRTYAAVEAAYGDVIAELIDRLDTRFCIGNHDAILAKYPPDWAFSANSRLAYAWRFCDGKVFAFHGHQTDDLVEEMAAQNGQFWVSVGSLLSTLNNSLGQSVQETIDRREDGIPASLDGWPAAAPPGSGPFTSERWSDRQGREPRVQKIFGGIARVAPAVAASARLVITGHTHRPGVGWFAAQDRVVPVVDVGSWTYGRSQFAIAVEGSVSLWQLAG